MIGAIFFVAVIILILFATKPMPVALVSEVDLETLWEEGLQMNECAECHPTDEFHSCDTCHDDHGSVELAGVTSTQVVEFTGDMPDRTFLKINAIIPNPDNVDTTITVRDLLAQQGVENFESITLITNDGGSATIEAQNLDDESMLAPYGNIVRFTSETVHASSWLKGIVKIIVIGNKKPFIIVGKSTSIGRLLAGDTIQVAVEGTDVMLADHDGNLSHAYGANWIQGAPLLSLLKTNNPHEVIITGTLGQTMTLSADDVQTQSSQWFMTKSRLCHRIAAGVPGRLIFWRLNRTRS